MMNRTCNVNVALSLLLMISGCVTNNPVPPEPFETLRDGFSELRDVADGALTLESDWEYETFIEELDERSIRRIGIDFPPETGEFGWASAEDPPLFMSVRETQTTLAELNATFTDYLSLLAQLAGGEFSSPERFRELAMSLNDETRNAAEALEFDVDNRDFAFFSTIAIALARDHIEGKRQDAMVEILASNQPVVDSLANLGADAAATSAAGIRDGYGRRRREIDRFYINADENQRESIVEELMDLNDRTIAQLDLLKTVAESYRLLSQKHAALKTAVEKEQDVSITEFLSAANRLKRQYKDLKETE